MGQYLPLAVLLILAAVFVAGSLVTSKLLAPDRKDEAKLAPYECGIVPTREPPERFPVKFYLVAMIFIVFDIEIIFLYPWATIYRQLGPFGLFAVALFSAPHHRVVRYLEFSQRRPRLGPGAQRPAARHGLARAHHRIHRSPGRPRRPRGRRRSTEAA